MVALCTVLCWYVNHHEPYNLFLHCYSPFATCNFNFNKTFLIYAAIPKWVYLWQLLNDFMCDQALRMLFVWLLFSKCTQFVAPSLPLESFAFSVVAALSWSSVYILQLSRYRFPLLKFFCLSEFIMFTFIDMFKSPILLLYRTTMVWTLQQMTTLVVRDGWMYLMTHCEVNSVWLYKNQMYSYNQGTNLHLNRTFNSTRRIDPLYHVTTHDHPVCRGA